MHPQMSAFIMKILTDVGLQGSRRDHDALPPVWFGDHYQTVLQFKK
jgi:hypothetical protein